MLELYHNDMSTCAQKVRLTLEEKGLTWESRHLDLRAGDQQKPDYLKLNPRGVVPTIVDNGKVVRESTVIMEYLDDEYPYPPLMPKDPYLRGRGRILVDYALNYIHEPYWLLRGEMLKPQADRNSATLEQTRSSLRELLRYLETALGDNDYFLGALSLTDIDVLPRFLRMESYGALPNPELPRLGAWLQRMKERPSVKAIL